MEKKLGQQPDLFGEQTHCSEEVSTPTNRHDHDDDSISDAAVPAFDQGCESLRDAEAGMEQNVQDGFSENESNMMKVPEKKVEEAAKEVPGKKPAGKKVPEKKPAGNAKRAPMKKPAGSALKVPEKKQKKVVAEKAKNTALAKKPAGKATNTNARKVKKTDEICTIESCMGPMQHEGVKHSRFNTA